MENYLQGFLIAMASAIVLNVILKRVEIPSIIGYIITGVIVSSLYQFHGSEELSHIAEFGIVFLMFTIGLEFSFKHLLAMKQEVFLNGSLQMLTCGFACALIVFFLLGLNDRISIIVGFALALSSTAVVLKILNDSGEINQNYGRKALGILLFQDIAVIPLLLMVDIFSTPNNDITSLVIATLASAVILIILLLIISRYFLDGFFRFVIKASSQEIFITTILFIVIGASFLAHKFGFSYSLGAFLAGALIGETRYKHKIQADLIPFRDLLLGVFFVSVGMQINFKIVFENWSLVLFLVCLVLIVKFGVIYLLLRLYTKRRVALKTALSIMQIGEFALAIFSLLQARSLLDDASAQILIITSIITMVITPFVLKNIQKISNAVETNKEIPNEYLPSNQSFTNHFVIFGYGRLGQEVVQRIKHTGIPYLVLESDLNLVELGTSRGENIFFADATQEQTLQIANIEECAVAIITLSNEAKLEILTQVLSNYKKPIQTIVQVSGDLEKILFLNARENFHIIKAERAVARTLVQEALECKINSNIT
ncbi:potassium transporter [Campylobacter sp. MIT 12-8780]|uniref:cation:proton antiporter domain-containing protein n=1 Tax=unclassified Campylobacter TaxID=2593542 RepID=UPI00115D7BFA|nr:MULTISPECIES: cation:proton antiporter [unclassified Campylobacter]NDJ27553.1 potassium transporter [Campylobacter sp. MIT 19-121]TQR41307.1 potassium transporter [Campylobacter sp. MIT 12-8780]